MTPLEQLRRELGAPELAVFKGWAYTPTDICSYRNRQDAVVWHSGRGVLTDDPTGTISGGLWLAYAKTVSFREDEIIGHCPNCDCLRVLRHLGKDVLKCASCGGIYGIHKCCAGLFELARRAGYVLPCPAGLLNPH